MGHITNQYGPYYRPIWAILLSNKVAGGERLAVRNHSMAENNSFLQPFRAAATEFCSFISLSGVVFSVFTRLFGKMFAKLVTLQSETNQHKYDIYSG
ncbi:MAG: hypothetical protein II491_03390 [Prevotella sp.]|nr:hypothetical protein [Prevotella sp.]